MNTTAVLHPWEWEFVKEEEEQWKADLPCFGTDCSEGGRGWEEILPSSGSCFPTLSYLNPNITPTFYLFHFTQRGFLLPQAAQHLWVDAPPVCSTTQGLLFWTLLQGSEWGHRGIVVSGNGKTVVG